MSVQPLILDIGGEGRHPLAWNVNPSALKTCGPQKGDPIPRWLLGRADAVRLADGQADVVVVERVPLSQRAVEEIRRIARPGAIVVLRHPKAFGLDPHRLAKEILIGSYHECQCLVGSSICQQTVIELAGGGAS